MNDVVLVVGARRGSIGDAITEALWANGTRATTAGITQDEECLLDVMGDIQSIGDVLQEMQPQHVICTVGVNEQRHTADDPWLWYQRHMNVNVLGPMRLWEQWRKVMPDDGLDRHFVAISSNSARVPRTGSAAYCASKAALSMALRCEARALAKVPDSRVSVYGYEPGLVAGTPMTTQTAEQYVGLPLTRMLPLELSRGVSAGALARVVVAGLGTGRALNGCLIPFDADEG